SSSATQRDLSSPRLSLSAGILSGGVFAPFLAWPLLGSLMGSYITSPRVRTITISPPPSHRFTSRAWASASALPRVPILILSYGPAGDFPRWDGLGVGRPGGRRDGVGRSRALAGALDRAHLGELCVR